MQQVITLTLPYPPSANVYWRYIPGRRKPLRSAEAKAYLHDVAMSFWGRGIQVIEKPQLICVDAKVYRPIESGDLDNRIKIFLDALIGMVYEDDSQIRRLTFDLYDDAINPRVDVVVSVLTDWPKPIKKPRAPRKKKK